MRSMFQPLLREALSATSNWVTKDLEIHEADTKWDEIIILMHEQLGNEILEFVCIPVSWKRQAALV